MSAHGRSDTGPLVIVPAWLLEAPGVGPRELQVYCVLALHADAKTGEAWPSRRRIAAICRVASVRTIDAALKQLVRAGALRILRRRSDDGDWASSIYTVVRTPRDAAHFAAPGSAANRATGGADRCALNQDQVEPGVSPSRPPQLDGDLLDALTGLLGYQPQTAAEQRRWERALHQLAQHDATAEQVRDRAAAALVNGWTPAMLTPSAIAANWGQLGALAVDALRSRLAERLATPGLPTYTDAA